MSIIDYIDTSEESIQYITTNLLDLQKKQILYSFGDPPHLLFWVLWGTVSFSQNVIKPHAIISYGQSRQAVALSQMQHTEWTKCQ